MATNDKFDWLNEYWHFKGGSDGGNGLQCTTRREEMPNTDPERLSHMDEQMRKPIDDGVTLVPSAVPTVRTISHVYGPPINQTQHLWAERQQMVIDMKNCLKELDNALLRASIAEHRAELAELRLSAIRNLLKEWEAANGN